MSAPFNHKSAADIRARLDEIRQAEVTHTARDMDAELADVMRRGGDIDAMEAAQLEAERVTRRLRVERSALEAELPFAVKREGAAAINANVEEHRQLATEAAASANAVVEGWRSFIAALEAWEAIRTKAGQLTEAAWIRSMESSSDMPTMGWFLSSSVSGLAKETRDLDDRLASAEHEMQVGTKVHGYRIDG